MSNCQQIEKKNHDIHAYLLLKKYVFFLIASHIFLSII